MREFLKRFLPHKELGWVEIGEQFTRYTLLRTRWGNVYLHRLRALKEPPECHDHPWSFVTFILWGGYNEYHAGTWTWRRPGSILFRPAEFSHNVVTRGTAWSIVVVSRKRRDWGFHKCDAPESGRVSDRPVY